MTQTVDVTNSREEDDALLLADSSSENIKKIQITVNHSEFNPSLVVQHN
jgi:hypothetical protein